jgi:hypothetical protein
MRLYPNDLVCEHVFEGAGITTTRTPLRFLGINQNLDRTQNIALEYLIVRL